MAIVRFDYKNLEKHIGKNIGYQISWGLQQNSQKP